jgi:hypothetical protein
MNFTSEFITGMDGGTMYYSLDARAPFPDQSMWEFAGRLPARIHFRGDQLTPETARLSGSRTHETSGTL